jgi:hypothetical protein
VKKDVEIYDKCDDVYIVVYPLVFQINERVNEYSFNFLLLTNYLYDYDTSIS